jgi:hypothetical protein
VGARLGEAVGVPESLGEGDALSSVSGELEGSAANAVSGANR